MVTDVASTIANGHRGRWRSVVEALLGTRPYDPRAAEDQIYRTIEENGLAGVNVIRAAESTSYTRIESS